MGLSSEGSLKGSFKGFFRVLGSIKGSIRGDFRVLKGSWDLVSRLQLGL